MLALSPCRSISCVISYVPTVYAAKQTIPRHRLSAWIITSIISFVKLAFGAVWQPIKAHSWRYSRLLELNSDSWYRKTYSLCLSQHTVCQSCSTLNKSITSTVSKSCPMLVTLGCAKIWTTKLIYAAFYFDRTVAGLARQTYNKMDDHRVEQI